MVTRYPKTIEPGALGKENEVAERRVGEGKDEACRCKETSKMSPRELLKVMLSDLAFWKKGKKE